VSSGTEERGRVGIRFWGQDEKSQKKGNFRSVIGGFELSRVRGGRLGRPEQLTLIEQMWEKTEGQGIRTKKGRCERFGNTAFH